MASFRPSKAFEATIVLENVNAKHIKIFDCRGNFKIRREKKINRTVVVWIRKTMNNERLRRDDGLIFKPMENSSNSTPNSAGKLSKLCLSPSPNDWKRYPEKMKPIITGTEKNLQI